MIEVLLSVTPFKTTTCSINEERQYKSYSSNKGGFFFRMDLVTKYSNQDLYSNHSHGSKFVLECSFWALKRTVVLDISKIFVNKTYSPNGLCQNKIMSKHL